ncbi:Flagellar basal-body rod protein FlgG [hydrothermal vent metagenome]|uniref:Flagellar basal-body rod protein FlgG n=1 Tax=hydrothermal vent metagenome TaxID=652676 RepID=A0A3B0TA59_9ZZZZ
MENALLVGLSQQTALRRQMDIVANNLANMSTTGFKSETPIFEDFVMPLASGGQFSGGANEIRYVRDSALFRSFAEGPLNQTGNALDMAINGKGWFVIGGPDGDLYTRNGNFRLDLAGQIVTSDGLPVLTEDGPIVIGEGESDLTITADGLVTTSEGTKGQLNIVEFENQALLQKQASSVYSAEGLDAIPSTDFRITQGALEGSNVNAISEITEMIAVTRAYTKAAEVLDSTNTLRRRAIETLGQAPA